jgi:hypothetical protein
LVEAIRALGDEPSKNLRGYLGNRGWPDNKALTERLVEFALYRRESKKCQVILQRLERKNNPKETIDASNVTIEHIMPQSIGKDKKGKAWQAMLGPDWKDVHETWLHTLGNLTLSGYNSDLGNKSFDEKRLAYKGSNFGLNRTVGDRTEWNAGEIKRRGEILAKEVAVVWPRPVSGDYVPPDDEGGKAERKAAYKQRRVNYWNDLVLLIKDSGDVPLPKEVSDDTAIYFPVDVENVALRAWIVRKHSEITVSMTLKRRHGHQLHAALLKAKSDLENAFGESLHWDNYQVQISRPDSRIIDEDDWFDQHDWLLDNLSAFYRVIVPKAVELDASGLGAGSGPASKQSQQKAKYWAAVREFAQSNGHQNAMKFNANASSVDIPFGNTGYGVKLWAYMHQARIGVRLKGNSVSKLVKELKVHREEIEEAIGCEVFALGKKGRPIIQIDRKGDIKDESNWNIQHEWLLESIVKFETVLTPYIEKLNSMSK